jgi:2-polyprenyl-3-methyl-5-hydroxy-6-metoxy-1,4-benzoquinol methylase
MKRWQTYSKDPNKPELFDLRKNAIRQARSGQLINDRIAYLCSLATGKSVLDIGVVEHTQDAAESPLWLHGHLKRCAASCLGVDLLEEEVEHLRAKGYDVTCADITKAPLPGEFDLIVAGEVLEHLDSPGQFMENCATMLSPEGRLAVTVPNPWYANAILKSLPQQNIFVDSADHVAWYDASVLYELGQRHGLELNRFTGVGAARLQTLKAKAFFSLRPLLIGVGLSAELFAKSIIYEFVHQ